MTEREAIVAWLRADVENMRGLAKRFLEGGSVKDCATIQQAANQKALIADAIERGDHWESSQ